MLTLTCQPSFVDLHISYHISAENASLLFNFLQKYFFLLRNVLYYIIRI
nr:MAG TPA: hypothetical protein [Caudoviricetes sp.]